MTKLNHDITVKAVTDLFQDKALQFFGIKSANVKAVEPTEISQLQMAARRLDYVCLLEDDTYLHLEFQTTDHPGDRERFLQYDVALYEKKKKSIRTVVVYGKGIREVRTELDFGSVSYRFFPVYMEDYDGDLRYEHVREKINSGEPLTEEDQLNLIFLPLMRTNEERSARALQAAELALQVPEDEQQLFVVGCILALSDKFVDQDAINQLKEVLQMSRIWREMQEEMQQKAQQKAQQEVSEKVQKATLQQSLDLYLESLSIKQQVSTSELREKVRSVASVNVLTRLQERLFLADTVDEVKRLVDELTEQA